MNNEVLICSTDPVLVQLLSRLLVRLGRVPRHVAWAACHEPVPPNLYRHAAITIVDLCCPAPECWQGIARARAVFEPGSLRILAHAWAGRLRAEECQPAIIMRKPLALGEILATLQPARSAA